MVLAYHSYTFTSCFTKSKSRTKYSFSLICASVCKFLDSKDNTRGRSGYQHKNAANTTVLTLDDAFIIETLHPI